MDRADYRTLTNFAVGLRKAGDEAGAEAALRRATALEPRAALAWEILGKVCLDDGRHQDAEAALRRALEIEPGRPDARWALARTLLALGQPEGWEHYEARFEIPELHIRRPPLPVWEPGTTVPELAVWPEQGFGDQIMASRFAALVGQRAAVYCAPPLVRLFQAMGLDARSSSVAAFPAGSRAAPMLSLPRLLGVHPTNPPPPLPVAITARRVGGRIGVMTVGSPQHTNDAHRSLPADAAARLLSLEGAVCLAPEATGARDFLETAEIVAGLDAVITVDTAVAHLAGTLGKPTWVLLPAARLDWRWLTAGATSPWYPSMRLVRRANGSAWEDAIEQALGEAAGAGLRG
jgi:hypothetical protein